MMPKAKESQMIEVVSKNNLDELLPLIKAYQAFYNVADICDTTNREFFSQFGSTNAGGCQFLYRNNCDVVGFATVYFSFASSIPAKVAILNDLYTSPKMRGKGIGKMLIEYCRVFAKENNAVRLQWVTAEDNIQAQKLYDSLNISKSSWLHYAYNA